MKIIIIGCGKVGCTLTEQLIKEGHELTLIDNDSDSLNEALSVYDVGGIVGNGVNLSIQKEAGVEDADLVISVTDHDEVNLLCCLIAKKASNCKTIARVRNPEYYDDVNYIKEDLGLSLTINPELAAANEIARLVRVPGAKDVDSFAKGRINMVQFVIPKDSMLCGMKLMELPAHFKNLLICVILRGNEVIIPVGSTVLEAGDTINMVLPPKEVTSFFQKIGVITKPIRSVMIAGGGTISYYLAKTLLTYNMKVTIIETKRDRCKELSASLPGALIIHGDATDKQLLLEEGITKTDCFISLTNLDEENILLSLYAGKVSGAKIITKINRIALKEVIDELPLGTITSPRKSTAEFILQFVRGMQNTRSSNIETLYRMFDDRVEALEFIVKENSKITEATLAEHTLKPDVLVCSIYRDKTLIIPSGRDKIQLGDTVIIVTKDMGLESIDDILA